MDKHSRRCIDGSIVGSAKCVGYCKYDGHEGFLTKELRRQHNCIKKECVFYVPLRSESKFAKKAESPSLQYIVDMANKKAVRFEAMRFLKVEQNEDGSYDLFYVAIAEYPLDALAEELENEIGAAIRCKCLDYDYETCVKLIFSL